VGAEAPGFDFWVFFFQYFHQVIEQPFAFHGVRRPGESGARAALRIGGERELRHYQQTSRDVGKGTVHFPRVILEHPERNNFLSQTIGFYLGIAALDADQGQQAGTDLAHRLAADAHRRAGDALQ
jgi:hypothetical protein